MFGSGRSIFFILNLVQDVNIIRGLAYLAARETRANITLLVSKGFAKRDHTKIWQREVIALAAEINARICSYASTGEALSALSGNSGIIFAASESSLAAHQEVSDVFRAAPPEFLRITLQHGFECVGFRQGREHIIRHGRDVSFHADIICSWFDRPALTSMVASERAKLYVSGPPTLLYKAGDQSSGIIGSGMICENMHSVRFSATGDHKTSFMDIFTAYCAKLAARGEAVTLRPHPGGQYVLRNKTPLPANVRINNAPMFRIDLKCYRYGISAPSTILFDMLLAGIPVGVWRDPEGVMDTSAYEGLTKISGLDEWLAFERDVQIRPEMLLDRQAAFLDRLAMPKEPEDIYRRFARLIVAGLERAGRNSDARHTGADRKSA